MIRVETDVTNLPFTATDKQHQFVTTLRAEDLRVLEDGVPQKQIGERPGIRLVGADRIRPARHRPTVPGGFDNALSRTRQSDPCHHTNWIVNSASAGWPAAVRHSTEVR